jgi:hypothetical protein
MGSGCEIDFSCFHQSLQVNVAKISQLRHDHFLSNQPFIYQLTTRYVINFLTDLK